MNSGLPVIVLGAGCAGLSAAWRLRRNGVPVVVVEARDRVGGLAGGERIGDDTYEFGPHVFHTTDPEIRADIRELMGAELLPYRRTILIKFGDGVYRFPLSARDVFSRMPLGRIVRAGASWAWQASAGALFRPAADSSETVLRRSYGDVLYRQFFKDYITRVWGLEPAGFSPAFARERIPRLNILEGLEALSSALRRGRRGRALATTGFVEKVEGDLYTTRRGFSLITQRMGRRAEEAGAAIRLETAAERIFRRGGTVTGVAVRRRGRTEILPCRGLISTLAVNEAAGLFEPAWPSAIAAAAAALRFRAIVFCGFKVRRPRVLPASFMYFREHAFNRVTDYSHFGFDIRPAGHTLLVAETTCDENDRTWNDEEAALASVTDDLEREAIVTRDEIVDRHVFKARHAQPMYTLGYERALRTLLDALDGLTNIETAGRQGRFQYVNSHVAMKMGWEAADRLTRKLGRG